MGTRNKDTIQHTEMVEDVVEIQAKILRWRRSLPETEQGRAEAAAKLLRQACEQLEAMDRSSLGKAA